MSTIDRAERLEQLQDGQWYSEPGARESQAVLVDRVTGNYNSTDLTKGTGNSVQQPLKDQGFMVLK